MGFLHGEGGFIQALEMNHRPSPEPEPGDAAGQQALISLFELAPRVGFDVETAQTRITEARAAMEKMDQDSPVHSLPAGRSLAVVCDEMRTRLASYTGAGVEDAILGAKAASRSFDQLMDEFLTPEGGWIMGYDKMGLPVAQEIPAIGAGPIAAALRPLVLLLEA
ncbi:MAG: hypothetical protein MRY64_12230 [Hyphomonadaceae bacterium]|nr:hypothetical protein [Hyphomonadaceae bacterium]